MPGQIELVVEKMNHGHWLRVTVPYTTNIIMTAMLQNSKGEMLKTVKLVTGNNLIDIEMITDQNVSIKIDTPFETLLKELVLR
ncbi:MAG TPA: hypothetical protein VFG10_11990 [Saprospiraceae bacterium]|nr:hypothetical protein [Saprospiraceae bacterium]